LRPPTIANQKRRLPLGQPVVRLHEQRETSLDRKIAIAAWSDQSLCVKLMPIVANEFPKSGKIGNIQRHREGLMSDLMPCVLRQ
jgi:hypothetical protein